MPSNSRFRPSAARIALIAFLTAIALASLNALPAMRDGQSSWSALQAVLVDSAFWVDQMLPIAVMYVLMLVVFPYIYDRLVRTQSSSNGQLSWTKNRWLVTISSALFLVTTGSAVLVNILKGTKHYSLDQLGFVGLMWVLYAALIIYLWTHKPSKEWRQGFESGDHSRSMDERYQLVLGKSATTTLYWTLGLIFVAGSLYDILITHTWPVRSLFEAALIFILWSVIYRRLDKTI